MRETQPTTYEVLTESRTGHQTVHRLIATSPDHAKAMVKNTVADTTRILDAAPAGQPAAAAT
jgi:hypothetical protein